MKIVFYGPALSGKTTNLQKLHSFLDDNARGRLMTLDTADDRTLFFDLLPVFLKTANGFKIRLKLFTVPGQVMHNSTRRVVLTGADGLIFVADSQRSEARANTEAWRGMMDNLKQIGIEPDDIPIVIQFNKRDLPNIRTDEELARLRESSKEPIFPAVAVRGEGVVETLYALLRLTYRNLDEQYQISEKFSLTEKSFLRSIFKNVTGWKSTSEVDIQPGSKGEL